MKLANAVKLLSQYGEVNQDESGARIKIDGWTYGASTNWNEQEVLFYIVNAAQTRGIGNFIHMTH